jgi:outer membrane protein
VTAGYGALDGSGNPIGHVPIELPNAWSQVENDTDDNVWSASLTWFVDDHWAIEAWTAQGAKHRVEIDVEDAADIHLADYSSAPITATVQYHFGNIGRIVPFVGAGWHWTRIGDVNTNAAYDEVAGLKLSNDSGLAAVAGIDINLANGWFARADARWMDSSTDTSTYAGAKESVSTDSTWYGLSIGYRF